MKVTCPDCFELVPLEECLPVLGFINCPECAIGSPALEWLSVNSSGPGSVAQRVKLAPAPIAITPS